jgi:hypothetical protein
MIQSRTWSPTGQKPPEPLYEDALKRQVQRQR